MTGFIQSVVHFAEAHAALVYAIAFIAAGLESIAVIGLIVPGSGILVALGALIPSGAVSLWWLCLFSILGALLGDGLSYWFGHRHRDRLRTIWPFDRHPGILAHGERFFAAHGGKSVFLSRFTAPVRGAVPLVAGMAGMAPRRFFAINVLSALGWAPAHILPGALIGAGLVLTHAVATRLVILVVVLLGVLWLAAKLASLSVRRGLPLLAAAERRLHRWAGEHDGWLARQLFALLDPSRGEGRVLALLGFILVAAVWTFFGVLEDVVSGDPLVRADTAVHNMLLGLRSQMADRVMIATTELGGAAVVGALVAAVLAWLVWRRAWHAAAYWVAAAAGSALIGLAIKAALHRVRPEPLYTGWEAFSFPSGHATAGAAIYGFLAVLLAREARPAWQVLSAAAAALMVVLIGFSRVYLGAHWFSDVVAGIAFGTAWMALLAIAFVCHDPPRLRSAPLAAIAIATVAVAGGIQISRRMPVDLERYAVRHEEKTMTPSYWWRDGWRKVPLRRVDMIGEREEPLVLQWAGKLADLRNRLTAAGWRLPVPWSLESSLNWIDPNANPLTRPVLPRLHDGRGPALTLIHADGSDARPAGRWVLRVWRSGSRLAAPAARATGLWVAAISLQRFDGPLAPFGIGTGKKQRPVPWSLLEPSLQSAARTIRRADPSGIQVMLAHEPALRTSSLNRWARNSPDFGPGGARPP